MQDDYNHKDVLKSLIAQSFAFGNDHLGLIVIENVISSLGTWTPVMVIKEH